MRRKRICLLINKLARGGAETQCVRLATGLHARGWRVRVVTLLPSTAFTDELTEVGIPVVDISEGESPYRPHNLLRLLNQFWSFKPDVLVTFLYQADVVGRMLGSAFGIPVRVTSIRNEFFGASDKPRDHWSVRAREELIRRTDSRASLSTTNSELAAVSLIERGIVPSHRLRIIRNMVDLAPFTPMTAEERTAFRREHGAEGDSDFVWVHAGRLETQKDQATLLKAFAEHCKTHNHARLWILGDGARRQELEALAGQLGVTDRVLFAGERPDVPDWLRAADAFVLSSKWEGLPNVLLEAAAARLPVVSTDVGGVREAMGPDLFEYLAEAGSVDSLRDAMDRLVTLHRDNRHEYDVLGETNFAHVLDRFGSGGVLDHWEGLFTELMRERLK